MGNGRSRADIGPLMYRRASGRKGRGAVIAGGELDRPELAYSVEKLFSGDFKVDVEGRRPLARLACIACGTS